MLRAVMDTNVLVAGLRSSTGASHELLRQLRLGRWTLVLGNTVASEYHEILHRQAAEMGLTHTEVDEFLDVLCALAEQRTLATAWEPAAGDPDDESIIQLAREASVSYLVTHNVRDVTDAARFGVSVMRPAEFLKLVRQPT